jgi:hypothetical protein
MDIVFDPYLHLFPFFSWFWIKYKKYSFIPNNRAIYFK